MDIKITDTRAHYLSNAHSDDGRVVVVGVCVLLLLLVGPVVGWLVEWGVGVYDTHTSCVVTAACLLFVFCVIDASRAQCVRAWPPTTTTTTTPTPKHTHNTLPPLSLLKQPPQHHPNPPHLLSPPFPPLPYHLPTLPYPHTSLLLPPLSSLLTPPPISPSSFPSSSPPLIHLTPPSTRLAAACKRPFRRVRTCACPGCVCHSCRRATLSA